MTLPLAAVPTSPTPGLWLTVDLTSANVAPGSQGLRGVILAPSNTTGNMTQDTEIRALGSLEEAEVAGGTGSLPSLCFEALRRKYPNAQIDLVCPTRSGGAPATGAFTASGTPSADGNVPLWIKGININVPWYASESPDAWVTRAVTYIGRYARRLFVTASDGTPAGEVTLTANGPGPAGNDTALRVGTVTATGGSVAVTAMSGGVTEPDFATAFGTIEGREYDFICPALSNADAASASGNVAALETHINGLNSGLGAKLQQGVVGHTGARTAGAVSSAARNEQPIEVLTLQGSEALPCEVGGDEVGDRMKLRALYISRNRIGNKMLVAGSADPVSDNPTLAQSDAALLAGLSIGAYDELGEPYVVRAVTTYSQTGTGAQVLPTDCNEIDALYDYAKDLRAALPVEFANAKVARDSDEPEDELPEGVVEERDIRAFIINRTRGFWIPKGVLDGKHFEEQVESGKLVVRVNDTDETQVDIFIPAKPFKNLAKLGVYVAKAG